MRVAGLLPPAWRQATGARGSSSPARMPPPSASSRRCSESGPRLPRSSSGRSRGWTGASTGQRTPAAPTCAPHHPHGPRGGSAIVRRVRLRRRAGGASRADGEARRLARSRRRLPGRPNPTVRLPRPDGGATSRSSGSGPASGGVQCPASARTHRAKRSSLGGGLALRLRDSKRRPAPAHGPLPGARWSGRRIPRRRWRWGSGPKTAPAHRAGKGLGSGGTGQAARAVEQLRPRAALDDPATDLGEPFRVREMRE